MDIQKKLIDRTEKLAVVGLGYVGLPIAVLFSKHIDVIGFDINPDKIQKYTEGIDTTGEVGSDELAVCSIDFTCDEHKLDEAKVFIIAVPTPVTSDKTPDLSLIKNATALVGRHLSKGAVVVFESTVYPGVTDDICIPLLESTSSLKVCRDFMVGYSPERINPGDKVHRLNTITKIVSGADVASLNAVKAIYDLIIDAGTFPVSSIKTAEAVKVAENSQRDINIAFMNELAIVFERMGIDTNEVLAGMNTKWNALHFFPGLVGGHCIGVDPYYFSYEAERLGYHSQIILSGRKINESMSEFVASAAVKQMILAGKVVLGSKVGILGLTFKENCSDIRNTKVIDIIKYLKEYGVKITVCDPWANAEEARKLCHINLVNIKELNHLDCLIVAVSHNEFKKLNQEKISEFYKPDTAKVLLDVKGIFSKKEFVDYGFQYWSL